MIVEESSIKEPSHSTNAGSWDVNLNRDLRSRWSEFVNCPKRLKAEGKFLLSVLSASCESIFDAAMGTGCEALFLAENGYNVTGNEIDDSLSCHALSGAHCRSVRLRHTKFDWLELKNKVKGEQFDAVLILGNSLCLLKNYEDRLTAAKNFRAICREGGIVIIDERNFDYMLRERKKILCDGFKYSGNYMYCGNQISGTPVYIADERVRFEYKDVRTQNILGYFDMHPFKRGEMQELFFKAGFKNVCCYSDFRSGYNKDADFHTYVFS